MNFIANLFSMWKLISLLENRPFETVEQMSILSPAPEKLGAERKKS